MIDIIYMVGNQIQAFSSNVREWSLIKGRVGYKKGGGGGQVKFYSYKKGRRGTVNSFEVVLTREPKVLAIPMGGAKCFLLYKKRGGGMKVLPCLWGGGGAKSLGPAIFPFCTTFIEQSHILPYKH